MNTLIRSSFLRSKRRCMFYSSLVATNKLQYGSSSLPVIRHYNTMLMPMPRRCYAIGPQGKMNQVLDTRQLLANDNLKFTDKGKVLVDETIKEK